MVAKRCVLLLLLNIFYAFSQIPHDISYVVGCFENGTTEVQFEFDAEEVLYVDFERQEVVYTVPKFLVLDPTKLFENMHVYNNAMKAKRACKPLVEFMKVEEKKPPEEKDPPESILYPAEDVQFGVENSLTCFVNHFYPPYIKVSWTKNGRPVSEGVSLSRYYPNNDQTFHQFSTLTFTPMEGDMYSCTVEHSALDSPKTRIWEPESTPPGLGPDIFCGVGLTVGLVGVAVGTFLMVKGHHRQ
ncbi:H-2 class II histocompatibility antigen, A-U alpha chain [Dicentrarchus labrax]|uniref:H-2 class II histocompatibility antigen, A-U alpha chain n=1 Tax=Dicentrarchus labrax TaxID=13489 RepID=UPI0021F5B447|nr:H-2 class II histocompatibility antigen, A-U alpha chain [Dicentrarchus labrax]XP_051262642.1 H-2 class II histocompatibility antigen, A-U alpha chain [Dicentrarchus labrax]